MEAGWFHLVQLLGLERAEAAGWQVRELASPMSPPVVLDIDHNLPGGTLGRDSMLKIILKEK